MTNKAGGEKEISSGELKKKKRGRNKNQREKNDNILVGVVAFKQVICRHFFVLVACQVRFEDGLTWKPKPFELKRTQYAQYLIVNGEVGEGDKNLLFR